MISDRFVDRDIFMRYLGLGIGHTIVGKPDIDDADEKDPEAVELGTGPLDDQYDDWGNQGGEQGEPEAFEYDMDGKEEEEEAGFDKDEDEDEELEEEDDDNYSDTDLGYDDL